MANEDGQDPSEHPAGLAIAIGAGVGAALFAATGSPVWIGVGAALGAALHMNRRR